MKKRLLSLGLALVMLLSLLPASVLAKDYAYNEKPAEGAKYAVGDTIVVEQGDWEWDGPLSGHREYDLPGSDKIPADTKWEKVGEGNCNVPAHWGNGWRVHTDDCDWGDTYVQFRLVSTATPDPDQPGQQPDPGDDDTPGKVTASKTAVDNGNGTYTITLSVQGNKTTATTAVDSDVVLLVDNSTSMTSGYNDRLTPAKTAAKQFVNTLLADGKNNRVAVYGFAGQDKNGGASDSGAFTVGRELTEAASKQQLISAIEGMATDSKKNATNYTAALAKAKSVLDGKNSTRNGVVVFITDGAPSAPGSTNNRDDSRWNGADEAAAIKTAGYTLYTIGINISGQNLTYLNGLASTGCSYNVNDSNLQTQLNGILSDIAYQIREVAAGTEAVIEDTVNLTDYEFVLGADGEPTIVCSTGTSAIVDKATGKVTWTIGDIPDNVAATCQITVKANNTTALREQAEDKYTNTSVKLSYYVGEDKVERTNLGDPYFELPANAAKYTVNHFKANADGTYPTTASDTEVKGPVLYGTEITPDNVKKTYTGYVFDHADQAKLTVSSTGSNVINLYYTSSNYAYTINYYKDSIAEANKFETVSRDGAFGSTIDPDVASHVPDGYTADGAAVTGATTIGADPTKNVVNVVYQKRSDLSYTVNYLESGTNTVLHTAKTANNQTFGAVITAADEAIAIGGYTYKNADKTTLTIGTDNAANVINLYYEKAYTLTYDPGMGSGTPVVEKHAASPVTLKPVNALTGFAGPEKCVFLGWSTTEPTKILDKGDTLPTFVTSVEFSENKKEITVYAVWAYDKTGGQTQNPTDPQDPNKPEMSNGTADILEATITYKVVNGTWDGTDAYPKYKVFKIMNEDGSAVTPAPTLGTSIPTGMKPADGYANSGAWNPAISDTTSVTGDAEYTFTFSTRLYKLIYNGNAQGGGTVSSVPTDSYRYAGDAKYVSLEYRDVPTHSDVNGKKVVFVGWSETPTTKIYSKDDNGLTAAQRNALMVTSVDFNNADKTVYAVWSYDEIGNGQNGPGESDGKPDVLQAAVTYKVVNGYWADGTTADKVYVFDLMEKDEENGHGRWLPKVNHLGEHIPIPTGMTPAAGCTGGAWDEPAPAETYGIGDDMTFTYRFTEIGTLRVDPEDPNGDGKKDDALVWKKLAVSGTGFRGETFTVTLYPVTEGDSTEQGPDPRMLRSLFEVEESYTGTVTMTAAGTKAFSFTEDNYLTFTEPGHYWFKVVETKGSTKNMTYDEAEYYLYIQIGQHNDGSLYVAEYKDSVTVENSYKGSTGVLVPADKLVQLEKGDHFNYVMGYSDGTIRPNNQITRAEVAIIFFRLLTKESRDYYYSESNDFTDVAATSKSNIAISTLTKAGILTGYSDGTFRPNAKVTRGQLAAIIARFADMKGDVDKTFTDIDGYWAKDLILLAASNGWIDGFGDGTFRPANYITRAQTMAIINRALDRQVSHVEDLLDEEVMNVWVDNMDPEAWYYFHVQEATNYHSYVRKGVNTLDEKWTAKIEDIDWAVYQF